MATPAGKAGFSFPLNLVEEGRFDPASYVCPKCERVVRNPFKTQCGYRICQDCVPFPPVEGMGCPIQGCESCGEHALLIPDRAGRKVVKETRTYCPHPGCHKEPTLAKWEAHVARCPYGNTTGHAPGVRRETDKEPSNGVCPQAMDKRDQARRQQHCPPHKGSMDVHMEFLLAGNASLQRDKEELRQELCRVRTEPCKGHAKLEMQIRSLRQEIPRLKESLVAASKNQAARLRLLEAFDSIDGTLLWPIQSYAQRKVDSLSGKQPAIYSPPFRVGRTGYKMCLRACLGGEKHAKGNHLSLYVVIMKGEYDALLPWPFNQNVTLEVLDQGRIGSGAPPAMGTGVLQRKRCGPICHHIRRFILASDRSVCDGFARPAHSQNNPVGYSTYVKHEFLESAQRQYIKDDVLFVKVTVDMEGLVLP